MTAGVYLYAWIAPLHWRESLVAELMVVMLVERPGWWQKLDVSEKRSNR